MAVGPLHIDPSWEKLEDASAAPAAVPTSQSGTPASPVAKTPPVPLTGTPVPPHVTATPQRPQGQSIKPPTLRTPRKLPVWLFAVSGLVVVGGVLIILSEYGTLSLGIEQLWGLSNRAGQALTVAASTLGASTNYRVTGKVTIDHLLPVDGTASGDSSLAIEFVQDRATGSSKTTGNVTFHPATGQEQLFGPLLSGAVPVAFQLVQVGQDAYVHIDTVDAANQWEKFSASDANYLSLKPASWSTVVQGVAQSLAKGNRLPKQRIENVTTKGYHTQVSAASLGGLLSSTTLGASDQLDVKAQVGVGDKRPYQLTLDGPVSTKTLRGTLAATFNMSSFGSIETVVPPTADQVKVQSVPLFLSQHGLVKAESVVGRDVQRKADLRDIAVALVEYAATQHPFQYPKVDGVIHLDKDSAVAKAIAPYLPTLPSDPLASDRYYGYSSDGTRFELTASLENTGDASAKQVGTLAIYSVASQP